MRANLHIQNLKYAGCKTTIINRLSELNNVFDVDVDLNEKTVSFEFNTKHDFDKAKRTLSLIGYPTIGPENKLYSKAKFFINRAFSRIKKKRTN